MSKSKKDKKKKKKQKQLEQVLAELTKFNIIELLKTTQIDTKPNIAKFLDQYVQDIHVSIRNNKVQYYPTLKYDITKVFVRFLDGHELLYFVNVIPKETLYFMYDELIECLLKEKEIALVKNFFDLLFLFNFVQLSVL